VSVGGSNVLQSTLFYIYENFLEQVNMAEQLTSSDFGVSTGLISQGYWDWIRWYYVNIERSQATWVGEREREREREREIGRERERDRERERERDCLLISAERERE
jgi:hypothetical protein